MSGGFYFSTRLGYICPESWGRSKPPLRADVARLEGGKDWRFALEKKLNVGYRKFENWKTLTPFFNLYLFLVRVYNWIQTNLSLLNLT